jgi:hypothetical protein
MGQEVAVYDSAKCIGALAFNAMADHIANNEQNLWKMYQALMATDRRCSLRPARTGSPCPLLAAKGALID